MLATGVIFLQVTQAFIADKFKALKALKDSGSTFSSDFQLSRSFEPSPYLQGNRTLANFEANAHFNKVFACDFLAFEFVEPGYRELLEYHTLAEFNAVRAKDFISFPSFHAVYADAARPIPFVPNQTQLLVDRLRLASQDLRIALILISGAPGSGKHRLGEALARMLAAEGLPASTFKASLPEQLRFSAAKFV